MQIFINDQLTSKKKKSKGKKTSKQITITNLKKKKENRS